MKLVSVLNVLNYTAENPDTDELKTAPKWVVRESCNFFLVYGERDSRQYINLTKYLLLFKLQSKNNFPFIMWVTVQYEANWETALSLEQSDFFWVQRQRKGIFSAVPWTNGQ